MKKHIFGIFALTLLCTSCADSFLDREPAGGTITQSQFEKLDNAVEGSVRGIYSLLYNVSDHDQFGQRSIDMYTDILSGDMALTDRKYGWFATDEQMATRSYRTGYIWTFYYRMIHNINQTIRLLNTAMPVAEHIADKGFPVHGGYSADSSYYYLERERQYAYYYAQLLAMRGFAYGALMRIYVAPEGILQKQTGVNFQNYYAIPYYDEDNMDTPQPLMLASTVYNNIERDLSTAIQYFEHFGSPVSTSDTLRISRPEGTKLEVDINVARGLLAYTLLNEAYYYTGGLREELFTKAMRYAAAVIDEGTYHVLPNNELYTTGFNSVSNSSWIWGQAVTTETAGGLASFFGQVDIHSYSYAWAGDTKVIDSNLWDEIKDDHPWDGRNLWFNQTSIFEGCPDGKFFSAKSPNSTSGDDIDREWLSDNVFMRVEAMHLIAAEAALRLNKIDSAVLFLTGITDERLNLSDADASATYASYKANLSNPSVLEKEINYNWRVELWGEGYGLQTFMRLTRVMTRGSNHLYYTNKEVTADDSQLYFDLPSSEYSYNPNISTSLGVQKKLKKQTNY